MFRGLVLGDGYRVTRKSELCGGCEHRSNRRLSQTVKEFRPYGLRAENQMGCQVGDHRERVGLCHGRWGVHYCKIANDVEKAALGKGIVRKKTSHRNNGTRVEV